MKNKQLLIENMLLYDADFAIKYMMKLYDRQTLDEQQVENSIHQNKVGFNAADAPVLSVYAERVRGNLSLSIFEINDIHVRMHKYAKQLVPIVKDEELIS